MNSGCLNDTVNELLEPEVMNGKPHVGLLKVSSDKHNEFLRAACREL
jgi:hypothetical protein